VTAETSPSRDAFPYEPSGVGEDVSPPPAVPLADASAPLPEDPAEQAFSLLLSGELKFRQRNLLEAESYLRRAVELHARLPDADPGEQLRALDTLGAVHVARGDLARAEPVLRSALKVAERIHGIDREDLGPYLNQLAHVLFKRRRFADAEPVLARLVAIKRRLGDEHPEVASVVANLALVHESLQRYDSAETLWRCALVIRERSLPDDSPAVSMAREHLADMCAANGRPEEAIALRERALDVRTRSLPADHPQVTSAKAKLTALKVEGVRARIPVVVPQARPPERHGASPTPQSIPRPPARTSTPRQATPPLPRDVLDDIVRATRSEPAAGRVMSGMRGRARQLLERPLMLIKSRGDAKPEESGLEPLPFDEDEDALPERAVAPQQAAPRGTSPRPLGRVVIPPAPIAQRLADAAPTTWEDDEDFDHESDLPDDGEDAAAPHHRFDVFGDALWPRTRVVLAVVALTLILAVAAAGVARMAGGTPADDPTAAATVPSGAAAASPAAVPAETRRIMDAGLEAAERAANGTPRRSASPGS
jgi:tetratricopeptide (TPR) repeat protein